MTGTAKRMKASNCALNTADNEIVIADYTDVIDGGDTAAASVLVGSTSGLFLIKTAGKTEWVLELEKGEEVILYTGDEAPDLTMAPLAPNQDQRNYYGLHEQIR